MSQEIKPENIDEGIKGGDKTVVQKIPCSFPGCTHKEGAETAFDVILKNEKNAKVRLPFCQYHFYIVMGNHFEAVKKEDFKFELVGPFKEIELIEQVMGAREMIQLKKTDRNI